MTELFRDRVDVSLTVNGEPVEARVPAGQHMIDFLRLELGLTGAYASCEHGVCGACTIRVDGDAVRGCLMLAAQADGAEVWTVEGLTDTAVIRDLQDAFVARNALQCGFCTPGMLVSAEELLSKGGTPSRAEIREHLSGNYCRCTGYEAIIDAVERAAQQRAGNEQA
ncbi:2Fe-2S iron-sulfur cluster binding domain-containing protein [Roseobacter sp. HKCCD9010]|uniref:(2Fe-2S)-binding protein n=1 Tax=unclassified Roseobacter TaxID=196798 RepID=UPI001491B0A8|nr:MULTISPECIES: (2Fe-2S)-binding protein [unclassified Roseobacter]MBF9052068.1 2Fe-2S iron-sulfur cluster binding domain-containing protein [Rhodobacterales bacterium HKCCD4356]NNV13990.1 2Fe-2S iron-sulfur cluster binding domain-containing protein [Roseobacter sp. HKCCD7357]NNV18231.1 2Fe-2S iron-sulfur cluster binding domain-containing protein [Roseobacter sp. HKCCD8768]NNV27689.1 2Fe-2S iron-sulfur cluster binding domain-containing protein [Roseobacter sp. HKCCD8192]NNV31932.1 2Fe-2S iron